MPMPPPPPPERLPDEDDMVYMIWATPAPPVGTIISNTYGTVIDKHKSQDGSTYLTLKITGA